jgi:hypothetical protein
MCVGGESNERAREREGERESKRASEFAREKGRGDGTGGWEKERNRACERKRSCALVSSSGGRRNREWGADK